MPTSLPPPGDPKTLYLLDISGYIFRAYHGVRPLSNSKGEVTHAVFGVANMLNRLVREQKPVYLAVAMDSKPEASFRRKLYAEYKANRPPPPPDLAHQIDRCRQLSEAFALPVLLSEGYEADDLIAACVREARSHGLRTVICSADKDLMQLVSDDVVMWDAMRDKVYAPADVVEKWGVKPEQVCDLLALMGDTSDNVPGVTGVGEKTAAKLITDHGSLDGVYQNLDKVKGKLRENLARDEASARLSYKLVCLAHELPAGLDLETLRYGGWDPQRVKTLYRELEFTRLADALEEAPPVSTLLEPPPVPVAAIAPVAAPALTNADSGHKRYETVLTVDALDAAIAACRAAGVFALDTETTSLEAPRAELVGVSMAWQPDHAVYIPIGHRVIGDPPQIPRDIVLARLRPLLADATVAKLGQNIKYDDIVLRRAGAPVAGYRFDTMIASYLLDPEKHSHKLDEIALGELGYEMISYDQVTKKAKGKQLAFEEVDVASATKYAAEDADVVWLLEKRLAPRIEDERLADLMNDVEVPLALLLSRVEETGVLVDVPFLQKLSADVAVDLARLEGELHTLAGKEFNVNSPRQLESILFDELKLPVIKRTKTGRSTDHEVLEELAERMLGQDTSAAKLPGRILEQRMLAKLKGTYLDALPAIVNPASGRIHTSYAQAVAATGRLSSNNPNLQNIPIRTEIGRRIREAFIAPPGHSLLAADYSQIELRVLAHLAKDPILLDAFQKNEDIHTRTAMEIFKVPANEVTKGQRARAKTTNFAVIYGQGESALGRQLGIARDEAGAFIDAYFKTFPGLTRYLDQTVSNARAGQGVTTLLGRRRFLPNLGSSNRGLRMQAERIAKNTPIQGTAADIMKLAMIAVDRRLTEARLATKMILTVHDELVFEVPDDEKTQVESLVRETMQGVMKLEVPLIVDVGWGRSWGEAH